MKNDTKRAVIVAVAVLAVFGATYMSIAAYSGTLSPFYTVESGSMRHSDRSKIGIIDTGDMVIVRDPSKTDIITYVEGHETGYQKFGDYGDVIIYDRPGRTPVIHRVILYLESNDDKAENGNITWSIPSLENYKGTWYIDGTPGNPDDANALEGTLSFENFGYAGRSFELRLYNLNPGSGYITMGDANDRPDQESNISQNTLVSRDRILAVAAHEMPWLGCIKLLLTGKNINEIPSNSLPSLITVFVLIFITFIVVNLVLERTKNKQ